MNLPPFPVDDATLDMLDAAMNPRSHGDPDAKQSGVWEFLTLMSELGGSDTKAVAEVHDDGSDGGPSIVTMRDPHYHDHDVIQALIEEIRRLRALAAHPERWAEEYAADYPNYLGDGVWGEPVPHLLQPGEVTFTVVGQIRRATDE